MQKLKESKVQSRLQKVVSGIYQIINSKNNKSYVGSSKSIYNRIYHHKIALQHNKHGNTHLQRSWNKYGEENFNYKVLELIENPTKERLEEREDYWINFYESDKDEKGYNKQKAQQGTFTEKWHQKEKERKKEKQTKKDYNYYSNKSYFKDVSEEDKQKIISNLLKYTESCFISINRKSNKMQITLTNHTTFEVKKVYIFLNPLQTVTKEEFDKSDKNTRGGLIFRIEPGTSNIIESFTQPVHILNKYSQIKRKQLERILYNGGNFHSTQKMIFVREEDYDSNKNYYIGKFKEKIVKEPNQKISSVIILELNEQGQPIKEFIGIKSVLKEYPEITSKGLQKVLYENRKSTKGHYFILKRNFPTN